MTDTTKLQAQMKKSLSALQSAHENGKDCLKIDLINVITASEQEQFTKEELMQMITKIRTESITYSKDIMSQFDSIY